MKVIHDSRNGHYRTPYGAVTPGTNVTLTLSVHDAPPCTATVRLWDDQQGETLVPMQCTDEAGLLSATITPAEEGTVWYHFIIQPEGQAPLRYGATPGRVGGEGQLYEWEPPSFQLTVANQHDFPPAWYEPIGAYLYNEDAQHDLTEIVETFSENFPRELYADAFPWVQEHMGTQQLAHFWEALPARAAFPSFRVNDHVFGFTANDQAGNTICTLINASTTQSFEIPVPLVSEAVTELNGGYAVKVQSAHELSDAARAYLPANADPNGQFAIAYLQPVATCVFHFHNNVRLQQPLERGLGVLAHITSLPAEGPGTLGAPARAFVDWLAEAGVRYWQVLPVNPTDEFGSPYAGISAFAGNARLLENGEEAATKKLSHAENQAYRAFREQEAGWLKPYATFMAIRQKLNDGEPWQEWPQEYHHYHENLLRDKEIAHNAEYWCRVQFAFQQQWDELRAYANNRSVKIIGDMPLYVSADSADVWAHPEIFQLDEAGLPAYVAGCAPDAFAPEGQVWGNPLYNWDAHKQSDYAWWLHRLKRAFHLYDYVRLDHFIGFSRYFSIPAGGTAADGHYYAGPGFQLFQRLYNECGPLPVIAEDLGLITPGVRALSAACGFPGMDIAQFVDGNDPLAGYTPRPEKIAYTGTHDNQTLAGYCAQRYAQLDTREATETICRNVASCPALASIMPLQDVLCLGDEARMNVPGVAEGNWQWQANKAAVLDATDSLVCLVQLREE